MATDGTTVIRFYGVEDPNSPNSFNSLPIGIGRISKGNNQPGDTTAYVGGEYAVVVAWGMGEDPTWGWGWIEYLSGVSLKPTGPRGSYVEAAFVPLDETGAMMPILPGELPLKLKVGFGGGDYSGGVIQIGMYHGGEFHALAAWEHKGAYFPYLHELDTEGLPEANGSLEEGEGRRLYVTLENNLPASYFWTALKSATEIL